MEQGVFESSINYININELSGAGMDSFDFQVNKLKTNNSGCRKVISTCGVTLKSYTAF